MLTLPGVVQVRRELRAINAPSALVEQPPHSELQFAFDLLQLRGKDLRAYRY